LVHPIHFSPNFAKERNRKSLTIFSFAHCSEKKTHKELANEHRRVFWIISDLFVLFLKQLQKEIHFPGPEASPSTSLLNFSEKKNQ